VSLRRDKSRQNRSSYPQAVGGQRLLVLLQNAPFSNAAFRSLESPLDRQSAGVRSLNWPISAPGVWPVSPGEHRAASPSSRRRVSLARILQLKLHFYQNCSSATAKPNQIGNVLLAFHNASSTSNSPCYLKPPLNIILNSLLPPPISPHQRSQPSRINPRKPLRHARRLPQEDPAWTWPILRQGQDLRPWPQGPKAARQSPGRISRRSNTRPRRPWEGRLQQCVRPKSAPHHLHLSSSNNQPTGMQPRCPP